MMTLQDFFQGWPAAVAQPWPWAARLCLTQQNKQTPKKPLGAEEMESWKMLEKKLLACPCGQCLTLVPLSSQHGALARRAPPQLPSQGGDGVAVSSPWSNAPSALWVSNLQPWRGLAEPLEAKRVLEALVLRARSVFVRLAGVVLLSADF